MSIINSVAVILKKKTDQFHLIRALYYSNIGTRWSMNQESPTKEKSCGRILIISPIYMPKNPFEIECQSSSKHWKMKILIKLAKHFRLTWGCKDPKETAVGIPKALGSLLDILMPACSNCGWVESDIPLTTGVLSSLCNAGSYY